MPHRRSPGRILVVTLLVVTAGYLAWRVAVLAGLEAYFGGGFDEQRFNRLQQEAEEAEEYADAHGFRSTRPLGPGWTILGPIDDIGREEKQFP